MGKQSDSLFRDWAGVVVLVVASIVLAVVGFLVDQTVGFTMTLVGVSLATASIIFTRHKEQVDAKIGQIESKIDDLIRSAEICQAQAEIDDPVLRVVAKKVIGQCLTELNLLANGIETIRNETEYFTVLGEELARCSSANEVWDVVMTFNPDRVVTCEPLKKYLDRIRRAVQEQAIVYNAVLLVYDTQIEATRHAVADLAANGVKISWAYRDKLPPQLIGNFTLFPSNVCTAERALDGTIVSGTRNRNVVELRKYQQRVADLRHHIQLVGTETEKGNRKR